MPYNLQCTIKSFVISLFFFSSTVNGAQRNLESSNLGYLVPVIALLLEETSADEITLAESARFLTQATYGPTHDEIVALSRGSYSAWLDRQLALPATRHIETGIQIGFFNRDGSVPRDRARISVWNSVAMNAPDQLRQRMAFALSQILVVNDRSTQTNHTVVTNYYDLLVENAFGNYRDLLEKVTLNGVMGSFLGMAGNQRANASLNILRPDENFAREVLQLFSIGLEELNQDGTPKLDARGKTIPTYDQGDIQEFAKVFTGWHYDYVSRATFQLRGAPDLEPMRAFNMYHDTSSKRLLAVPGQSQFLPANQSAEKDLDDALDLIFNHPNVGPFISKQLIQRFVTSNPSPAYVGRVAGVFNNNGSNVRGDLAAVIRAILLDSEARKGHLTHPETFGKMREPILRATAFWRGVGFLLNVPFSGPSYENLSLIKQSPLQAPSVFNFYRPNFSPAGKLARNGLLSPESQLLNIASIVNMGRSFTNFSLLSNHEQNPNNASLTPIDTLSLTRFVPNNLMRPEELIERLNLVFLAGSMPDAMRDVLLSLHDQSTGYIVTNKGQVVNDILYLIALSPYFLVQR